MLDKLKDNITALVAVIGAGYWGKNLVRNFHNLGSLKLICDKNESLLADLKNQYAGIETCLALADVLKREDIGGVVISTPAETHFNLARESLLAGKNVLVEKPLVLHDKEGEELISLAAEKNRVLEEKMFFCVFRFLDVSFLLVFDSVTPRVMIPM